MTDKKLRCLIVDDERPAIRIIESFIEKIDHLEVTATCDNAFEAYNVLSQKEIDLVFLDISMPQMTGLELLKSLRKKPAVIMTTAYSDYALDGFELEVTDYLLKPISFPRFLKAISKVTEVDNVLEASSVKRNVDYENAFVYVRCGKKMEKVKFKEIFFIESFRDSVNIHTKQKTISTYLKISELEERLPHEIFCRIHKSYIVSLEKIEAYNHQIIEINQQELPIGNYYKKSVLERLDEMEML